MTLSINPQPYEVQGHDQLDAEAEALADMDPVGAEANAKQQ